MDIYRLGLRENVIQFEFRFREDCVKMEECEKAGISVDVSDQRETGQPIRVSFKGDLRMQQELAAEKLFHQMGFFGWGFECKRQLHLERL